MENIIRKIGERDIEYKAYFHDRKEMCEVYDIEFIQKRNGFCINSVDLLVYKDANGKVFGGIEKDILGYDVTLLQYIGLEDKNGKMIFEGDIIECKGEFYVVVYDTETNTCPGYVMMHTSGSLHSFYRNNGKASSESGEEQAHEIVGNIFENPEMFILSQ